MKTYENSYFRLRLSFPNAWTLTSWRLTAITGSGQAYQVRDDDLPEEGKCASKFLFTAALQPPEREALVDADIELSVFWLSPGKDMRSWLVANFNRERDYYQRHGIVTSITREGAWNVGGMEFTYIDEVSKSRRGDSRYRFFFRLHQDAYWLCGKIAGHKRQAYDDALGIVEGLKSTDESHRRV